LHIINTQFNLVTRIIVKHVKEFFDVILTYGFDHYKDFIFGLIIGLFIAWIYHKYIGNKSLKNSYERLLQSKDDTIAALKEIIGGKLAGIEVEKKDKPFFDKIKRFFRALPKHK
jgi:uncharacterized membrane protein (DUF106 family)